MRSWCSSESACVLVFVMRDADGECFLHGFTPCVERSGIADLYSSRVCDLEDRRASASNCHQRHDHLYAGEP